MKGIKKLKQSKQHFSDRDIKTLIMKLSWGHKIAATYLVFVAGMVFLVFKANNEKFDLVTKDYYGAELKYQEVIDQGGEPITADQYFQNGDVTEFRYSVNLGRVFHSGRLVELQHFGEGWQFMPSDRAIVFTDNHDNQRGHGGGGAGHS